MDMYINFFHPATVCNVIALYTSVKRTSEEHPDMAEFSQSDYRILDFLVEKIVDLQKSPCHESYQSYIMELKYKLNDVDLVNRLTRTLDSISDLNSYYRLVFKILEDLKQYKMEGSDQCSIIDVFLRRLSLYFQRLGFKEMMQLYEFYFEFKHNRLTRRMYNEFYINMKIEEIKFNLQYCSQSLDSDIMKDEISIIQKVYHNSNKPSFLKGLDEVVNRKEEGGMDRIFRFFDLEFKNLITYKNDGQTKIGTVNQTSLNVAFSFLKLGFLDQAMRSINEGMRLSQNSSDEEGINNCIIYLYQISQLIGQISEQIKLTEHAITHSVSLNSVILVLTSCLNYSRLEKNYDCSDHDNSILRSRNVEWTHALHYARKKMFSNYEITCKGMHHFERNLLIPLIIHKAAIINHVPELKDALLQGIYKLPQIQSIDHMKILVKDSDIVASIKNARVCFYRKQFFTYNNILNYIKEHINESNLQDFAEFQNFKNQILIERGLEQEARKSITALLIYYKAKQLTKHYYFHAQLQLVKVFLLQNKHYEARRVLVQVTDDCKPGTSKKDIFALNLETLDFWIKFGDLREASRIIKKLEDQGLIGEEEGLPSKLYELKAQFYKTLAEELGDEPEAKVFNTIRAECENMVTEHCLKELNFAKLQKLLERKLLKTSKDYQIISHLESVFKYFQGLCVSYNHKQNSSVAIGEKLAEKIRWLMSN